MGSSGRLAGHSTAGSIGKLERCVPRKIPKTTDISLRNEIVLQRRNGHTMLRLGECRGKSSLFSSIGMVSVMGLMANQFANDADPLPQPDRPPDTKISRACCKCVWTVVSFRQA